MQERIPFDLEAALKGAKVVTRGGQEVKGLHDMREFGIPDDLCLTGALDSALFVWDSLGRRFGAGHSSGYDLFMAPPEPERRIRFQAVVNGMISGDYSSADYVRAAFPDRECLAVTLEKRDGKWHFVSAEVVSA